MSFTTSSRLFSERAGEALSGDLYLPEGPGPHPVLVGVPGGGWLRNRREQLSDWGGYLADHGFALFAIDYQRSSQGPSYPQNLQDVRAAIDFVKQDAPSLGLDAGRVGLLAASAGAHLAALAALTGEPAGVDVLVLAYGVYDLFEHWAADRWRSKGEGDDLTERMIGGRPFDDPARYFAASPKLQVTAARAVSLKAMLVWGDADDVVLPEQSKAFGRRLEQAGATVRLEPVAGAGHFWFSNEPIAEAGGRTAAVAPRVLRFLKQFMA